jgi:hypothetical protein
MKEKSLSENDMSMVEYAAVIREMIRNENELTNNRLTWLLVVQGFLFNAAASFWNEQKALIIIAILGILTSVSVFYALLLSRRARKYLRSLWQKKLVSNTELANQIPPVVGDTPDTVQGSMLNPWMFIPWIIIIAWALLIILSFF